MAMARLPSIRWPFVASYLNLTLPPYREIINPECTWEAVWSGKLRMLNLLLQSGASVDHRDHVRSPTSSIHGSSRRTPLTAQSWKAKWTALHKASMQGDVKILTALLSFGAPVDDQDEDGFTPLHRAVINGATPVVSLLISAKVSSYILA